ncbi:MAG TPA: hypothetical protein VH165_25835 [Kofleriaceae bacterium]|nr:hypothetical protein [Kofleriaceae bacterium]
MTRALALAAALAACSRRPPITSCDDDLRGVYTADPAGAERWMVLDDGATLEAYPLFPDTGAPGSPGSLRRLEIAPRVIDLKRPSATRPAGSADAPTAPAALAGTVSRRYMLRADRCDASAPIHVTRCAGDTLDLVLADPSPPLGFAPCSWPSPAPSHVVHWRRE